MNGSVSRHHKTRKKNGSTRELSVSIERVEALRRWKARKPDRAANSLIRELAILEDCPRVSSYPTSSEEMNYEENDRKEKKDVNKGGCHLENDKRPDPNKKHQESKR